MPCSTSRKTKTRSKPSNLCIGIETGFIYQERHEWNSHDYKGRSQDNSCALNGERFTQLSRSGCFDRDHQEDTTVPIFYVWGINRKIFIIGKDTMAKFVRYACVCSVVSDSLGSMVCTLPGFSTHGIFQARILEWVALFSSRGLSQTRDQTCNTHLLCLLHWQMDSFTTSPTSISINKQRKNTLPTLGGGKSVKDEKNDQNIWIQI